MDKLTVNIGWMYPNLLNLHGERGSIQTFDYVGKNLGIDVNINRIEDFDDEIPFNSLDILVFLPGEIKTLGYIKNALERQRKQLEAYINNGGYILAIGTTGVLFGKETVRENGDVWNGLGILDMTAKERQYVYGDDLHFRLADSKQEIIGSQIQMVDVDAANPLGSVIYGHGNNNSGKEGARFKNLIYTNCLGPVFVKNPWWAESIVKDVCLKKAFGIAQKKPYDIESNSFDSCLRFINRKPKFPEK